MDTDWKSYMTHRFMFSICVFDICSYCLLSILLVGENVVKLYCWKIVSFPYNMFVEFVCVAEPMSPKVEINFG